MEQPWRPAELLPIRNGAGMVSLETSQRILDAIFPNYPSLEPCNPAPVLEE